jgi:GDPmannose 4,6-dehydratase
MKKALITGINGQDGSYLSELLLEKGYEVWGTVKRNSVSETQSSRIEGLRDKNLINLEYADLTDMSSLVRILTKVQPDEVYNLAAQSHVRISFDQPIYTANVTGVGTLNLLEAVRLVSPHSKVYQASSSEMFGNTIDQDGYQRETTQMNPVSPYGCAKVFSYNICRNYRNSYGMKIWNGILFNHESPRRGTNFVTNKVVKAAVRISLGLQDNLHLGNLDATRDWGHAKDYVEAMWLMLQTDNS